MIMTMKGITESSFEKSIPAVRAYFDSIISRSALFANRRKAIPAILK